MANNPYVNKVTIGSQTVLDLTGDTVDSAHLAQGYTAHCADGSLITGSMEQGFKINGDKIICNTNSSPVSDSVKIGDFVSKLSDSVFRNNNFTWDGYAGIPMCMKQYSENISLVFLSYVKDGSSTASTIQSAIQAVVIENGFIKQYGTPYSFGYYMQADNITKKSKTYSICTNFHIQNRVDILDIYEGYIIVKLDGGIYLLTLDEETLQFQSVTSNVVSLSDKTFNTVKVKNGLYLRVLANYSTSTNGTSSQKVQFLKINNNGTITAGTNYTYTTDTYHPIELMNCLICYENNGNIITIGYDHTLFTNSEDGREKYTVKYQYDEETLSLNFIKRIAGHIRCFWSDGDYAGIYTSTKNNNTINKYDLNLNYIGESSVSIPDWEKNYSPSTVYFIHGDLSNTSISAVTSETATIESYGVLGRFFYSTWVYYNGGSVIFTHDATDIRPKKYSTDIIYSYEITPYTKSSGVFGVVANKYMGYSLNNFEVIVPPTGGEN